MKKEEKKIKAVITLYRDQLAYDISNYAYVEGETMQTQNERDRALVMDVTQDGNVDRVNRILNLGYNELVEMMYPFTKSECDDEELRDDILVEPTEYVFHLTLPELFSKTSINHLSALLHEYMVCRVLSDWFNITKHPAWESWQLRLADISEQIRSRLNVRRGAIRRKQSPF